MHRPAFAGYNTGAMTRTAVVVSILLSACASQPRQATVVPVPPVTHDSLRALPTACGIADTTATTRDTIYALGVERVAYAVAPDCAPHGVQPPTPVVIGVTLPPGTDLKDALDGSLPAGTPRPDVIVTNDPDVIALAARDRAFLVDTLPWQWLYVLMTPGPDSSLTNPTATERDALARDAVRQVARGAVLPANWMTGPPCPYQLPLPNQPPPIVAFEANDVIGRQLAERVVALAAAKPRPTWIPPVVTATARVAPLPIGSSPDAARPGRYAALVVRAPIGALPECSARGIAPLIEARAHAIVRRGSGAAFVVKPDGTLSFYRRGSR
jgi:hypothetical protein